MKTTWIYTLILLTAFGLGLGCKKEVEPVNTAVYPPGCRIVRTFYKNPTIGRSKDIIINPEIITLEDGSQVEVSSVFKTSYSYDKGGKITEINYQVTAGGYFLYRYTYTDKKLYKYNESFSSEINIQPNPSSRRDTLTLDQQGLRVLIDEQGKSISYYNTDRQFLGDGPTPNQKNSYENGNLVEQMVNATWVQQAGQWTPLDYRLTHFSYDPQRPNLPVVQQFLGEESRNLPMKEIWEMQKSSQFPNGPVYQKTFTYSYDAQGRVKRRLAHGKALYRGWFVEDDPYGVGVTDYEYQDCL